MNSRILWRSSSVDLNDARLSKRRTRILNHISLRIKNLSFGRWMRAVLDGELKPLRLPSLLVEGFIPHSLTDFAFRKDQFHQYIDRYGLRDENRVAKKKRFMPLWAMTVSV